jgi:hypothetical protein
MVSKVYLAFIAAAMGICLIGISMKAANTDTLLEKVISSQPYGF